MKGSRGGAFYALALQREVSLPETPTTEEGRVLAYVRQHGSIQAGVCSQLLGWESPKRAGRLLHRLADRGLLWPDGENRGRRYLLP